MGTQLPSPKEAQPPRNFRSMSVLGCLFVVFFITSFVFFSSVRQIKMAIGQVSGARTLIQCIVPYRIVSYRIVPRPVRQLTAATINRVPLHRATPHRAGSRPGAWRRSGVKNKGREGRVTCTYRSRPLLSRHCVWGMQCKARLLTSGNRIVSNRQSEHTHSGNVTTALGRKAVGEDVQQLTVQLYSPSKPGISTLQGPTA